MQGRARVCVCVCLHVRVCVCVRACLQRSNEPPFSASKLPDGAATAAALPQTWLLLARASFLFRREPAERSMPKDSAKVRGGGVCREGPDGAASEVVLWEEPNDATFMLAPPYPPLGDSEQANCGPGCYIELEMERCDC